MIQIDAIETNRLWIGIPDGVHVEPLLHYHERNEFRLARWDPLRPADFFTREFFERFVEKAKQQASEDLGYNFVAAEAGSVEIVARINLSNVVRGAFQAAYLGFSVDGAYEGRGYASEAVGAVVDFAFGRCGLHRVMASYQPTNERSAKLLRGLGFSVEGYALEYLYIAGEWRDSVLTSRIAPSRSAGSL
jgi:[ribosomal protein S5]-alanine N-acetyltransferase